MFGKKTEELHSRWGFAFIPRLCQTFSKFVPRVKKGNPKNIKPSVSFIKRSLFSVVKRRESCLMLSSIRHDHKQRGKWQEENEA